MSIRMNRFKRFLLAAVIAAAAAFDISGSVRAYAQAADHLPTVYIIGDSTVHNPVKGLEGWGDAIGAQFDPAKVHVENDALGGRSSRTFLTEGHWATVLAKLQPGDFVFIQFGHNDGGPIVGGTDRASLHGVGDESQVVLDPKTNQNVTVHTYGWYLRTYVENAKSKGAIPVIFSPIPRDIWSADGKTVNRNTADYGGWSQQVAQAENIPFVDLNAIVADKYDTMGFDKVKAAYFPGDHTHTSPAGAELNAESVVEGLKALPGDPVANYLLPNAPIQISSASATAAQ